jgi:hypothetical protein
MNGKQLLCVAMLTLAVSLTACCSAKPKVGHWESEMSQVAFDVTSDGKIRQLTIKNIDGCTGLGWKEDIAIEANGTFVSGEKPDSGTLVLFAAYIGGRFDSETKASGDYQVTLICDNKATIKSNTWTAEWKEGGSPQTLPPTRMIEVEVTARP